MTTESNHNFTCDLCGERLSTGFHKGFLIVKFIDKKVKINHLRTKHNYSISKIIVWLIKCICKRFKRINIDKK